MSGRKLRSNKTQIRMMVDFMSANTYMATGEFTGPLGTRKAEAQWLKLKDLLKNYGPDRSVEQWKQSWKDQKKNARHQNALNASAHNATENMPVMSETTKKILDTIGHDSSTDIGPAEPDIEPAESGISPKSNIASLLAERNELLREQNEVTAEANSIAKMNNKHRWGTTLAMTTDNNALQQVLELMKEINCKRETILANNYDLTAKVAKLETFLLKFGNSKSTTRTYGYVNWTSHHDILKTKQWKKLIEYIKFCGSLEREGSEYFEKSPLKNHFVIDEERRFPENSVYINVANPLVRAEILHIEYFIRDLDKPATGLVKRFLDVVKEDMHTCSSFEEKYGLKWIDPPKNT